MNQDATSTPSPALPDPVDVGEFYDRNNRLLTQLLGGSMHYGYWHGPGDVSGLDAASARMTDEHLDRLDVQPGMTVLDLGCGTGAPGVRLARWCDADITGVSVSVGDIALATARAEAEGVSRRITFRQADAARLPFADGTFDRVLAIESLAHVADRGQVLSEIARVLRPGGRVVLSDFVQLGPEPEDAEEREAAARMLAALRVAPPVRVARYEGLLRAAGLTAVEITDVTEHTKYTMGRFYLAMEAHVRERGALPPELRLVYDMCEGVDWVAYAQQPQTEGVALVVAEAPPGRREDASGG